MNWPEVALGDLCKFTRGPFGGSLKKEIFQPDGHPVYEQQHAINDQFDDIRYFVDEAKFEEMRRFELKPGELIMSCSGTMGKIAMVPDGVRRGIINQALLKINPGENLDRRFLKYWMESAGFQNQLASNAFGAAIKNVASVKVLKDLSIPLPPLEEQKRIAGVLDQAAELCRLRTRALDKLNTLGQAIFHEMFGSHCDQLDARKGTLGDFVDFFSGNTLPDGEEFADQSNGYLILKVSDLNREGNSDAVTMAASWSLKTGTRASTCPAGALVFPKRGGAIRTNKKRLLNRPAILDPNLMGVAPKKSFMTSDFLEGWFSCFDLSEIASGSSVPQLNKKDLDPLPVVLPSLEKQSVYSKRRSTLKKMKARAMAAQETANALFASLQHRAFRGEL